MSVLDFMVACTQFMNIIVHSVENMNYRVHLQYELTSLGLDDILETLGDNESERLITQVLLLCSALEESVHVVHLQVHVPKHQISAQKYGSACP